MAACLLALLMVLVPWSAFSSPNELEIEFGPSWVTGSSTASADTMLNVTSPNAAHGSSYNLNLSSDLMDERPTLLFTFPLTSNVTGGIVPVAGSIQSASVTLHFVHTGSTGSTYIHAAALNGTYEEANATYLNRTHNTTWDDAGANGGDDREQWEPRAQLPGSSGSVTVNITAIAQQALAAGIANLSIAVTSSGTAVYVVHSSEHPTTNKRPTLTVTHSNSQPATGAAVLLYSPEDGSVMMTPALVLSADTEPTVSWTNLSGSGVEAHFSSSKDFREATDGDWDFVSWPSNSDFSISGSNGTFTVPSSDALLEGNTIHWRLRSTMSDQLSEWESGWFLLPEHDVTLQSNGSANETYYRDTLNLSRGTIDDTWVRSGMTNYSGGNDESSMRVGFSNNTSYGEMHTMLRFDLPDTGMHTNATIESAKLSMRRTDREGDPWISVHEQYLNYWSENDADWNTSDGVNNWTNGGIAWGSYQKIGTALDVINGNKTGPTFDFDVTFAVQEYLRSANTGGYQGSPGISFILLGPTSGNDWVAFGSSEDGGWTYRPKMLITYKWGDGVAPNSTTVLSPLDGQGVWVNSSYNLTGDTTPTLKWDTTGISNDEIILELANTSDFDTGEVHHLESWAQNSGISTSAGTYAVPASWNLEMGRYYYWRIQVVEDGDISEHTTQKFFISELNSTYLGNNQWELRLRHGNASTSIDAPFCGDTYIDSLATNVSNDAGELSITSSQYTLFGCDVRSHALPPGFAVTDVTLSMWSSYISGSVPASVYELNQHLWSEGDATWDTYNGVDSWDVVGAGGSDRGQLLDSITIPCSGTCTTPTEFEWNVTIAVQNSMRWNVPVDFVIIGSGSGQAVMSDKENGGTSEYPELVIIYAPGSMDVPDPPTPVSPVNGVWSMAADMIGPEQQPTLHWNHSGSIIANGWVVEMDTDSTFVSSNYTIARSWSEINDFNVTARTYTPPNNLTVGQTWYWRARGSSVTNQLGNWSQTAYFEVPNINAAWEDATTSWIEIRDSDALPDQGIPEVRDTWLSGGTASDLTHYTSDELVVGQNGNDGPKSALLSMPLDELPQRSGVRIVKAELSMWALTVNTTVGGLPPRISAHPTLRGWTDAANGTTSNGTWNWSGIAGLGSNETGEMVDVGEPSSSSWLTLNVTEIAHLAASNGDDRLNVTLFGGFRAAEAVFYSSDSVWANRRPYLTLWLRNGTGTPPGAAATPVSPAYGGIVWDVSGHALGSDTTPTLNWTHPDSTNVSDWRVYFYQDAVNLFGIREGWDIFDSRHDSGFDLANLSYTPSTPRTVDSLDRWFVQPIKDDMLGPRSTHFAFDIPKPLGSEINSTDATLHVQEGSAVSRLSLPAVTTDTTLDSFSPTAMNGASSTLTIGRSIGTTSPNQRTVTLLMMNISILPVPEPWEVIDAEIRLTCLSNCGLSSSSMDVSVSPLLGPFSEPYATWNRRGVYGVSIPWQSPGAQGPNDSGGIESSTSVTTAGVYAWNVTQMLQAARTRGDDTLNLLFEGPVGTSLFKQFYSSEAANVTYRPALNITHRIGTQWLPDDVVSTMPASGSTLWESNQPRPTGLDPISRCWLHPNPMNVTSWQVQTSLTSRYAAGSTWLYDSSDPSSHNGSFNLQNLCYTSPSGIVWGDQWHYWRVRPIIGGSVGNWTDAGSFRVPTDQGFDDGLGNHTVRLYRGSVFEQSGALPTVPDTWLNSASGGWRNVSQATSTTLVVGSSPNQAGAAAVGLIQFDLSELPFPPNMLASSAKLQMYRVGYSGTGVHTVSVHGCSSFNETDTWNSFSIANNCNATALTSTTQPASGLGVWYEWDVAALLNSVGYNGVLNLAVKSSWSGNLQFASGETSNSSLRPYLDIEYVDNVNGTQPPVTPVLISPFDQQILYTNIGYLLESPTRPMLVWQYDASTTGYIVRISNATSSLVFHSWNTTVQGTFGLGNYTPGFDLAAGEMYIWSVQAINGSVLSPSSASWSFGIGDPHTASIGANIWEARYQEGADADIFNHPQMHDTHISSFYTTMNYGSGQLRVGVGCDGPMNNQKRCNGLLKVDLAQLPLSSSTRVHSAQLSLWLDDILTPNTGYVDVTAYALLNSWFDENQATWQQAALGHPWNVSGADGTDRGVIALDTVRINAMQADGYVNFDVSGALGAAVNGTFSIVLVGTPQQNSQTPQAWAVFDNSESASTNHRPILMLNYTSVFDVLISGSNQTTADNSVQLTSTLVDINGNPLSGSIEWTTSDGTVSQSGLFTPHNAGIVTLTARFGRVVAQHNITVLPGIPIQLVGGPLAVGISADETASFFVDVIDQFGNSVSGETITWAVTNGTLLPGTTMTTPVSSVTFIPWSEGTQWINASWGSQTLNIAIAVAEGAPDYLTLDGCTVVAAGEECHYDWSAWDQHGNSVAHALAGAINWTVENGSFNDTTGNYSAWGVGFWNVTVSSSLNMSASMLVETEYGEIDLLVLNASTTSLTADGNVTFTTVRIDVRGNQLNVTLPMSAWAWSNGSLYAEDPVRWVPWNSAPQWVDVTLENITSSVNISVMHGEAVGIRLSTQDTQRASGQSFSIDAHSFDQRGNQWPASVDAWNILEPGSTSSWLTGYPTNAVFEAVIVGSWTVEATYMHQGVNVMTDQILFTVVPGPLAEIIINGDGSDITADNNIDLDPIVRDANGNSLSTGILRWFLWDDSTTLSLPPSCVDWSSELTTQLQSNDHIWEASMVGNWKICAMSGPYQQVASITVTHGVPFVLTHHANGVQLIAGNALQVHVNGTDMDGNTFAVHVVWTGDAADWTMHEGMGAGEWHGNQTGVHSLKYTNESSGLFGWWEVTVDSAMLNRLVIHVAPSLSVPQQTIITVTAEAFDAYGNEIEVPENGFLDTGGDKHVKTKVNNSVWEVYMVNEGTSMLTLVSGTVWDDETVVVEQTVLGFFEEGGALYWVGAGLLVIVVLALIGVLLLLLRRGSDDEDDDDFYHADEGASDFDDREFASLDEAHDQEDAGAEQESADVSVDEDGTEWWEDEQGAWFYRTPDMDDWELFEE